MHSYPVRKKPITRFPIDTRCSCSNINRRFDNRTRSDHRNMEFRRINHVQTRDRESSAHRQSRSHAHEDDQTDDEYEYIYRLHFQSQQQNAVLNKLKLKQRRSTEKTDSRTSNPNPRTHTDKMKTGNELSQAVQNKQHYRAQFRFSIKSS